jgi:hypothetical protein
VTNEQYGYWMGTIMSSIPGSIGVWGILAGAQQGRIGPVVVGLFFVWVATKVYRIFYDVAQKWKGKE